MIVRDRVPNRVPMLAIPVLALLFLAALPGWSQSDEPSQVLTPAASAADPTGDEKPGDVPGLTVAVPAVAAGSDATRALSAKPVRPEPSAARDSIHFTFPMGHRAELSKIRNSRLTLERELQRTREQLEQLQRLAQQLEQYEEGAKSQNISLRQLHEQAATKPSGWGLGIDFVDAHQAAPTKTPETRPAGVRKSIGFTGAAQLSAAKQPRTIDSFAIGRDPAGDPAGDQQPKHLVRSKTFTLVRNVYAVPTSKTRGLMAFLAENITADVGVTVGNPIPAKADVPVDAFGVQPVSLVAVEITAPAEVQKVISDLIELMQGSESRTSRTPTTWGPIYPAPTYPAPGYSPFAPVPKSSSKGRNVPTYRPAEPGASGPISKQGSLSSDRVFSFHVGFTR